MVERDHRGQGPTILDGLVFSKVCQELLIASDGVLLGRVSVKMEFVVVCDAQEAVPLPFGLVEIGERMADGDVGAVFFPGDSLDGASCHLRRQTIAEKNFVLVVASPGSVSLAVQGSWRAGSVEAGA